MSGNASRQQATMEELDLRAALLAKDKSLQQLHKELVIPGHVSEEDFWETRRPLIDHYVAQSLQGRGLSSAVFAAIRPAKDKSGNTVRVTITKELMKDIFQLFPAVKKRHETKGDLPDEVFWTRVIQSLHFHREHVEASISSKNEQFSNLITEDDVEGEAALRAAKHRKIFSNPLLDLSSSRQNDDDQETARSMDFTMRPGSIPDAVNLIHRLNRQGERILKSGNVRKDAESVKMRENTVQYQSRSAEWMKEMEFEDLTDSASYEINGTKLDALKMTDSHGRFKIVPTDDHAPSNITPMSLAQYTKSFQEWAPTLQSVVSANTFLKLWSQIQRDARWSKTDAIQKAFEESVALPLRNDITTFHVNVNELLRHFYSSMPANTADKWKKVVRIQTALGIIRTRITTFEQGIQEENVLAFVKPMLAPIYECIDRSLKEFNEEDQKRAAKAAIKK